MASINLNTHWNGARQIDIPAGVETGSGFCENHADAAMQEPQRLAGAIGHRHPEKDSFCIGRNDLNTQSFRRSLWQESAKLFNGSNLVRDRGHNNRIEELQGKFGSSRVRATPELLAAILPYQQNRLAGLDSQFPGRGGRLYRDFQKACAAAD